MIMMSLQANKEVDVDSKDEELTVPQWPAAHQPESTAPGNGEEHW